MKGLISWFAENHVAANLLMSFIILAGLVTGFTMKIEVFPDTTMDRISITTSYPGASPSEVEEAIVRRIEETVAGLAGIKRIDSTAREGFGSVTIEVMDDWDLKKLLDEVKAEVDRITTFPEEAEKPVVSEMTRRAQVISVAVFGDASEATIKHLAEKIKDDITNIPGVTLAEYFAVRKGEIHVEVSEDVLRRYKLTLGQVAQAVRTASLDLPAGSVKTTGGEILLRTKGRRYYARDYLDVPVITRLDGATVTLGEIAVLKEGFEEVDLSARFQGKPAAVLVVYRVADQNALTVAREVKNFIEKTRPALPAGVEIDYYQDSSEILKSRINLLLKNMTMGLVLVSMILGVFLNLRLAFWVTLGIPISFLFSLMLLPWQDVSINMISLFAFIMVLGIVVDDAIIIGENIHSKNEEGVPALEASTSGAMEVGLPVIFSVLTTMVAFWPLLLGGGMMGRVMRNLPIVVILVLLGSLVESLLILPSHLAGSQKKALIEVKEKRASIHLKKFINGPYARMVDFCLGQRYVMAALGVALLLITAGLFTSGFLKFTFFPKVEGDYLQCLVTMPAGTPKERTVEVVGRLENAVMDSLKEADKKRAPGAPPLFEQMVSLVGVQFGGHGRSSESGGNLAHIIVQVLEGEKRNISVFDLTQAWRRKAGPVPEAESITFQSELFSAGNPIEIHLSSDDEEKLIEAAASLKAELGEYPGVYDLADSFLPGKDEMQLQLKPAASPLGLTLSDLAQQVRYAFYGAEALRFLRGQDEIKVMVRYPEAERKSLGHVEEMRIRTPDGSEVPFDQVAAVRMKRGYAAIKRAQRRRVIIVSADVDEAVTNANEVRQNLEKKFLPTLVYKYPGLRYTIEGEGKEQKESMADVFKGFLVALFGIYALLAIPFRSFTQPLVIMSAIPFGILGAVIGHLIMGFNLSIISMFGLVGLTGVVVNDSLVLIDAANRQRRQHPTPHQAVARAGVLRFRAVLLTSLTTFGGLTPMLMEKSLQAQFLIPMAISLGFGVLFATIVTLLLIPCFYLIHEDFSRLWSRIFSGPVENGAEVKPEKKNKW